MNRFALRCQPQHLPPGGWNAVLLRDPCVYCSGPATTIEHIQPKVTGGTREWRNTAPACQGCNGERGHEPLLVWLLRKWAGVTPPKRKLAKGERKRRRLAREADARQRMLADVRALNGWHAERDGLRSRSVNENPTPETAL